MDLPKSYQITNDVWMVPCRITSCLRSYIPTSRPFTSSFFPKSPKLRNSWKPEEDQILFKLVQKNGACKWSSLAKELNQKVHGSAPVRKGKQLRERWINQLNPKVIKKQWTEEEDSELKRLQKKYGNKWSEISKYFDSRTENQIKNRWKMIKEKLVEESSTRDEAYFDEFNLKIVENSGQADLFEGESEYSLDRLENSFKKSEDFYAIHKNCHDSDEKLNGMSPIRIPSFLSEIDMDNGPGRYFCLNEAELGFDDLHWER